MDPTRPPSSVVYLYGIVPAGQAVPGRDGFVAGDVALQDVVAIADLLPAGEFTGAALEARLQDMEWVTAQARRHTTVLESAMEHGPVVPARLCTLFSSPAALRDFLVGSADGLRETLERLRGRREWSLKIYCDEARLREACAAESTAGEPGGQPAEGGSAGMNWMLKKRRDALLEDRVIERSEQVACSVFDEMASLVEDIRARPVLTEAASGVAEPMILNAALLVSIEGEQAMQAAVEEWAAELEGDGYRLALSGPWPSFTFCEPEQADGDAALDEFEVGSPG